MHHPLIKRAKHIIAQLYWRLVHPSELVWKGFTLIVDPYVVPWHTKNRLGNQVIPLFDRYLNQEDVFVDVGASCGNFTLYASRIVQQVVAFEPTPEAYAVLQKNIQKNRITNVLSYPYAIGRERSHGRLYYDRWCTGDNSLVHKPSSRSVVVQIVPLDEFVPSAQFVKIDCEGMEFAVLQGMTRLIKQSSPLIFLEISQDKEEILRFLRSYNYTLEQTSKHNYLALPPRHFSTA